MTFHLVQLHKQRIRIYKKINNNDMHKLSNLIYAVQFHLNYLKGRVLHISYSGPGLNKMQRKVYDTWIHRKLGAKGIFIMICFIVVALVVDTSIVKISAFTGGLRSAESSIAIFTGMALIFAVGQYVILGFIRTRNHESIRIR